MSAGGGKKNKKKQKPPRRRGSRHTLDLTPDLIPVEERKQHASVFSARLSAEGVRLYPFKATVSGEHDIDLAPAGAPNTLCSILGPTAQQFH